MNSQTAKFAIMTKVLAVFSANRGDSMGIGQVKCLGERQ